MDYGSLIVHCNVIQEETRVLKHYLAQTMALDSIEGLSQSLSILYSASDLTLFRIGYGGVAVSRSGQIEGRHV